MSSEGYQEGYVIGIDIGTSAAKAGVFDLSGRTVGETHAEYTVLKTQPGWREQNAEWWWEATIKLLRGLTPKAALKKENLRGIAITHQRLTFVPVNKKIEPIYNAILWNDVRCSREVEYARTTIGEDEIFKKTGVAPGYWSIYKMLWLKNNLEEVYKNSYKFVLVPDFICYRLTGRLVTTYSAAILTGALDIHDPNRWCTDIIRALGVDEDKLVDEILPSGQIIGEITEEAGDATSLPEGVPVITAAGDQPCGALGAGLRKEGQVAVNGGTSCTSEIISETFPRLEDPRNYYLEISPAGKYLLETTIPSGGSDLMRWFRENFGHKLVEEAVSKKIDVWTYIYDQAKHSEIGSLGVILVPFFNGAGPPYWDLETGGVVIGLTTDTKYHHVLRAIIEGLAFEVKRHVKLLESGSGTRINELLMYGGSSRSDVWNQIFSDVAGVEVLVPESPETTSLGAAMCAAVGSGIYKSFEEAVVNMVRLRKRYSPNQKANEIYEKLFECCYSPLYTNVRTIILESKNVIKRCEQKS